MGLLVTVTVLVSVAFSSASAGLSREFYRVVSYGLACSQVGLVAFWCAWGRRTLPWRVIAVVLTVFAWSSAISMPEPERETMHNGWMAALLTQSALTVVAVGAARWFRFRLVLNSAYDGTEEQTGVPRPVQFSLGYLLAWVTSAAVIFGILKGSLDSEVLFPGPYPRFWWAVAMVGLINATVALSLSWIVLHTAWNSASTAGIIIAALAILLCGEALQWRNDPIVFAFLGLEAVLLLGSLCVVRIAGYRIVRRPG